MLFAAFNPNERIKQLREHEERERRQQQNIAPYILDTWGKSLQGLFASKGVPDILPRFTVDHLANLNSPFYQAFQQRRGQGEPIASIQPITNRPQGMLAEDMISLYALGFRDSLMRIAPHLGSRGIPIFGNMMRAPVIEPPKSAYAPPTSEPTLRFPKTEPTPQGLKRMEELIEQMKAIRARR